MSTSISDLYVGLGRLIHFLDGVIGCAAIGRRELDGLNARDPKEEPEILAALDVAARSLKASGQDGRAARMDGVAAAYAGKATLTKTLNALADCREALDPALHDRLRATVLAAWADPAGHRSELRAAVGQVRQYVGLDALAQYADVLNTAPEAAMGAACPPGVVSGNGKASHSPGAPDMPKPSGPLRVIPSPMEGEFLKQVLDELYRGRATQQHERRKQQRIVYRCLRMVLIVGEPEGEVAFIVASRNVSQGGTCLLHRQMLYPSEHCRVVFPLPENKHLLVRARVVRCRFIKGILHEIGVKFEHPIKPKELKEILRMSGDSLNAPGKSAKSS
jgi:hypothetical protein